MTQTYKIDLKYLEEIQEDVFVALHSTSTEKGVEEVAIHKALIAGGDQCTKILTYLSLKSTLIEGKDNTPQVIVSNSEKFNMTEGAVITIHQEHLNSLVQGSGKNDLMFYALALSQLKLLLFPGDSKTMNEATTLYENTLKNTTEKKKKAEDLFVQLKKYKTVFDELINKDFPLTLFEEIEKFIVDSFTNEVFVENYFAPIEEMLIALLGYPIDLIRERALVLLNCLYDGSLYETTAPVFVEKVLQVGDVLTLTNTYKHPIYSTIISEGKNLIAEVTMPQAKILDVNSPLQRTSYYTPLNMNIGTTQKPGEYDVVVGTIENNKFVPCKCSGGFVQVRLLVLPEKAKNISLYGVSDGGDKPELLTSEVVEEAGINMVHLVLLNTVKTRTLEDNKFAHDLFEKVRGFETRNVGMMVDFPLQVSSSVPESSPYRALFCDADGHIAGTSDWAYLNFRSVTCWDKAVEDIKTLQRESRVDAVRITSRAESLLPIVVMDTEKSKNMTGCVVDPQCIYDNEKLSQGYPNPFLRKLTRDVWKTNPDFVFFVDAFDEEVMSDIRSGVLPYIETMKAMWSPKFERVFQLGSLSGQIKALKELKEPFYPEKYPQGTTFAHQPFTIHPAMQHFMAALPVIPCLNSNNTYNEKYAQLNKKRALIREREQHLMIFGKIRVLTCVNDAGENQDQVIGLMREHSHSSTAALVAINTADYATTVHFDLKNMKLKHEPKDDDVMEVIDVVTHHRELMSFKELLEEQIPIKLKPFDIACIKFTEYAPHNCLRIDQEHQQSAVKRVISLVESGMNPKGNSVFEDLLKYFNEKNEGGLSKYIHNLQRALSATGVFCAPEKVAAFIHEIFFQINNISGLRDRHTPVIGYDAIRGVASDSGSSADICRLVLQKNKMGPIVFVTPELGRFSTIGGIGVLINELTKTLAELGSEVIVISPYYNTNKKGQTGYLKNEGVKQTGTVTIKIAHEPVSCGVHFTRENNVDMYFLHNYNYFPMAYPPFSAEDHLRSAVLLGKATLQLLCDNNIHPELIITNDWLTGMVPAYGKHQFGDYYKNTTFFHIVHNLEKGYIGDLYPDRDLSYVHELPGELVNNPGPRSINMSMCALKCSDNWGTVSKSYMIDALHGSPLMYFLNMFPKPFACSNGISVVHRTEVLKKISPNLDHYECKRQLQQKYFNRVDDSIPLFGFVGRICEQKGVFLLLDAIWTIVKETEGKCQFIIGGMAPSDDPYAVACASKMREMCGTFPQCFWAEPSKFFTDGPLMNMGCDFTCMPSMFEPSGLVQQESFLGGTPVIAFQTGGLKDTVFEYDPIKKTGNGFVFQGFAIGDLIYAIQRSIKVFKDHENYTILRQNASKSVLDLTDVAIAWGAEFGRLKKKVFTFKL
ncbi:starch synthase, putative [Entamoeba invadens IP1]|uniref:Starch synthase, putative n=1 Tax=Entamoeba invadens IP1 TaxID=370355 RepID=A0A0A1UCS4_ENTIV|nr:starch synthase, putative [Entamoeba invadens IP1]ELP90094.1 starch synthase, putative [Entamoeba invadens IP1]|eukprot:XP_004256865.1 starch synthase, putative [Entamoeba invadens IP1]